MLSNLSQFSPQGLTPQFTGFQAAGWPQAGWPQLTSGPFGQQALFGAGAQFGQDSQHAGLGPQQFPFGAHVQQPFAQNPFASFASNPYLNPYLQNQPLTHPLVQLAQQIAIQGAVNQQIGLALHQLAHHLALQGLPTQHGIGFGSGQPFAGAPQGAYGAFNPQAQAWGAGRSPTIQ